MAIISMLHVLERGRRHASREWVEVHCEQSVKLPGLGAWEKDKFYVASERGPRLELVQRDLGVALQAVLVGGDLEFVQLGVLEGLEGLDVGVERARHANGGTLRREGRGGGTVGGGGGGDSGEDGGGRRQGRGREGDGMGCQ